MEIPELNGQFNGQIIHEFTIGGVVHYHVLLPEGIINKAILVIPTFETYTSWLWFKIIKAPLQKWNSHSIFMHFPLIPSPTNGRYREIHGAPWFGYGSIPIDTFLVGWTSIYQKFWGSPGVQGFDTLPFQDPLALSQTPRLDMGIIQGRSKLDTPGFGAQGNTTEADIHRTQDRHQDVVSWRHCHWYITSSFGRYITSEYTNYITGHEYGWILSKPFGDGMRKCSHDIISILKTHLGMDTGDDIGEFILVALSEKNWGNSKIQESNGKIPYLHKPSICTVKPLIGN